MKNKKEDKRGENIFVGRMFVGIGFGFLVENIPAGASEKSPAAQIN